MGTVNADVNIEQFGECSCYIETILYKYLDAIRSPDLMKECECINQA